MTISVGVADEEEVRGFDSVLHLGKAAHSPLSRYRILQGVGFGKQSRSGQSRAGQVRTGQSGSSAGSS